MSAGNIVSHAQKRLSATFAGAAATKQPQSPCTAPAWQEAESQQPMKCPLPMHPGSSMCPLFLWMTEMWLLQLLLGLSLGLAPSAYACLQCEAPFRQALDKARVRLVAQNFRNERLRARAQALLLGMEREFFANYATRAYVGRVGLGQLSPVVALAQKKIQEIQETYLTDGPLLDKLVRVRGEIMKSLKRALKEHQQKACDPNACHHMGSQVLDCLHCTRVYARCLNPTICFGEEPPPPAADRQPRLALRYELQGIPVRDRIRKARIMVACLGVITFGVLGITAYTYRNNRRLLRGYRHLDQAAYE
ncbi:izumo sperm-egg fusion protein 2 [Petaurus breviceps papuanus]|uniref:izumo sperm-egg fusion protein 2 n=1 Tax=Petaurus breviceps papuanus TaxID=3040969 RepID=UPI0036DA7B2E